MGLLVSLQRGSLTNNETKYVTLHHEMSRNVPDGHFHAFYVFWK